MFAHDLQRNQAKAEILTPPGHADMHMGDSDVNPYLQQEVLTSSPARLRWMLIHRAHDLTTMVAQLWSAGESAEGNQWLLRIREILGELLDGVKDESNPLSSPISDFYLYLLQMSFEIERTQDSSRLAVLGELLAIEAETWRLVIEKVATESLVNSSPGALFPALDRSLEITSFGSSFSLEV